MSTVTLHPAIPSEGFASVFDEYPHLKDIWDEYDNTFVFAKEAADDWLKDQSDGEVLLIAVDMKIVGITGYWPIENSPEDAGLRWHGVVESNRREGTSAIAISLLQERLKGRFKYLHETTSTSSTIAYFYRRGFNVNTDEAKIKSILASSGVGQTVLTLTI